MPRVIVSTPADIDKAINWADKNTSRALGDGPVEWVLQRPSRSLEQNKKGWAMFRDFEPVEFNGRKWDSESWKCFLASAFSREMPAVGLLGEPVSLGTSTSKMSKKRYSEFIEFVYSEGSQRGVVWSEPAMQHYYEIVEREKAA